MRRRWTRRLTCFWRVPVTVEAASSASRDGGGSEKKSFFVSCTFVPVCLSLVLVSVTLDEVLYTGAGRDHAWPNGKQ